MSFFGVDKWLGLSGAAEQDGEREWSGNNFGDWVTDEGYWVYRVNNPDSGLSLRTQPTTKPEYKAVPELMFLHGEIVEVDRKGEMGGVLYVRVKGTEGWLFASFDGQATLLPVVIETGLWAYRVNNPEGMFLRTHPTEAVDQVLVPKSGNPQLYPHGMMFWADRKIESVGVTYVRVENTEGWLFCSVGCEQTLLPCVVDEGFWAYRVNAPGGLMGGGGVALRRFPTTSIDQILYPRQVYNHGQIVWTRRRVESGGVLYILAEETDGWLFSQRGSEQILNPVAVEEGVWSYRVTNPDGLSLRKTPTTDPREKVTPAQHVPHGAIISADRKIESGGVTYVRVDGTGGWLFLSRDGAEMMGTVSMDEGLWAYRVNNPGHGVSLRYHPTTADDQKVDPSGRQKNTFFPHGTMLWATKRLEAEGVLYVSPQDTSGWLHVTRGNTQCLLPVIGAAGSTFRQQIARMKKAASDQIKTDKVQTVRVIFSPVDANGIVRVRLHVLDLNKSSKALASEVPAFAEELGERLSMALAAAVSAEQELFKSEAENAKLTDEAASMLLALEGKVGALQSKLNELTNEKEELMNENTLLMCAEKETRIALNLEKVARQKAEEVAADVSEIAEKALEDEVRKDEELSMLKVLLAQKEETTEARSKLKRLGKERAPQTDSSTKEVLDKENGRTVEPVDKKRDEKPKSIWEMRQRILLEMSGAEEEDTTEEVPVAGVTNPAELAVPTKPKLAAVPTKPRPKLTYMEMRQKMLLEMAEAEQEEEAEPNRVSSSPQQLEGTTEIEELNFDAVQLPAEQQANVKDDFLRFLGGL